PATSASRGRPTFHHTEYALTGRCATEMESTAPQRDGHRMGADALARDAAGGVGGAQEGGLSRLGDCPLLRHGFSEGTLRREQRGLGLSDQDIGSVADLLALFRFMRDIRSGESTIIGLAIYSVMKRPRPQRPAANCCVLSLLGSADSYSARSRMPRKPPA